MTFQALHFRSSWPPAILVVLLLLVIVYGVVLYRRETAVGWRSRWLLAACRIAALGLLLTLLFKPVLAVRTSNPVPRGLLVLADNSASMSIRDTRKDADQLGEAAIALGKIPGDDPMLRLAFDSAVQSMRQAADALAGQRPDDANRAQSLAIQSLAGLRSGAPADLRDRLAAIAQRQEKLKTDPASVASPNTPQQAAVVESALADDLTDWYRARRGAGITLPDKLRAEMTAVPRIDLLKGALTFPQLDVFGPLSKILNVQHFRFAQHLEPMTAGVTGGEALDASGAATWMGTAIQEALDQYGGEPLAGVVLLTDGASNGGTDIFEAAKQLKNRGIPLFTVGIGLARPDDLSLRGLVAPDVAFANDLVPIRVQVNSSGYEKRSATLSVQIDGDEVAGKTVFLTGRPQFEELTFKAPRTGGIKNIAVSLEPLPGEATQENNSIKRSIRIVDDKIKVLCIEGSPRWEFRYLRAVLKRDPRIEAQFITTEGDPDLARASREHLPRFPEKAEQAFKFDLIILGDVRANVFTPTQLGLMEQLIREQGGSLILLAGHKHTPTEYIDTPIGSMLPVWIDQNRWEDIGDDVYPVLTSEGQQSSVMALESQESRNRALWANVRPLGAVAPLTGIKPGAKVLAELSDSNQRPSPYPLIAWQRYGAGKVMYVGTDCLWRLRTRAGDKYHLRFWGQTVQFLTLSRLLGENKRVRIETATPNSRLGQPVEIFANILTETYEPARLPSYTVQISRAGREDPPQPVSLQSVPDMPGLYHGIYVPPAAGHYEIVAAEEDHPAANTAGFEVADSTPELAETSMQKDLLERMAQLTGGRYLALRDLPLLAGLVQTKPAVSILDKEIELWDNWLIGALFVMFTGIEWAWRRKKNLA